MLLPRNIVGVVFNFYGPRIPRLSTYLAIKAAARAGGAEEIEVILRPMAYSRGTLAGKLLAATRRVVGLDRLHEEASRFVVRGLDRDTGKVEMLDLLSD